MTNWKTLKKIALNNISNTSLLTKQHFENDITKLNNTIKNTIGKSHWTNYYAWEYEFNSINLELCYTPDWNMKRFTFTNKNCTCLLKTNSIKEAIKLIKNNINKPTE